VYFYELLVATIKPVPASAIQRSSSESSKDNFAKIASFKCIRDEKISLARKYHQAELQTGLGIEARREKDCSADSVYQPLISSISSFSRHILTISSPRNLIRMRTNYFNLLIQQSTNTAKSRRIRRQLARKKAKQKA
jgi:hypothetical protein